MNCQLCNEAVSGRQPVCGDCLAKMRDGQHPIVCGTCYATLGAKFACRWYDRTDMDADTKATCDLMLKEARAVPVFFREKCPDCVKGDMPRCTSSVASSC